MAGRHRCRTCWLRNEPIGEQVAAARRRLAMVPPELRLKRTKSVQAIAPAGTAWCAGCQTFRDLADFARDGKATKCKPCSSAVSHAAMVAKTYDLDAAGYDRLLALQGGRCAICRARPKTKRLAVDHDHGTNEVRGLLCSRCNHDLMGSAWDSLAIAQALWHYLNAPPMTGSWVVPERQPALAIENGAQRPAKPSADEPAGLVANAGNARERPVGAATRADYAGVLAPGWAWGSPDDVRAAWEHLGKALEAPGF